MTEKELQHKIQEMATDLGIIWHHCNNPHLCTGSNGLPDLILLGSHHLAFAELKSSSGYLKADQNRYHYRLLDAGQTWYLWTPTDLYTGAVEAALTALNES